MGGRASPETGFRDYYSSRPEDDLILAKIENRENVLIVGPPLAGKTRAAYQAFKRLSKPNDVIIPQCDDINAETFLVPWNWKFWRPRILFLDDIHKFVEKNGFERLLRAFLDSEIPIVATCRSGKGEKIADAVNIPWANVKFNFNGTVGSIFLPLREMEIRFNDCNPEEKTILRAIKRLLYSGIYKAKQFFPYEWKEKNMTGISGASD
jgi:hypothetical protein